MGASTNGRAAIQAPTISTSDAKKIQNPVQFSANAVGSVEPWAAYMWLRFRNAPVEKTSVTCTTMNSTKKIIVGKCTARAHSIG